jgi:hypothetical protein
MAELLKTHQPNHFIHPRLNHVSRQLLQFQG